MKKSKTYLELHKQTRKVWGFNPKTRCKPNFKQTRRNKDKQRQELQNWE